jgi:hypothetical protein
MNLNGSSFFYITKGYPMSKPGSYCLTRSWGTAGEIEVLVNNLYDSLAILLESEFAAADVLTDISGGLSEPPRFFSTHYYQAGEQVFSVSYDSTYLENYIHCPLQYLECPEPSTKSGLIHFGLFSEKSHYGLSVNHELKVAVREVPQLKQFFFIELAGFLYGVNETGWMTIMHASAVKINGKLIALCSSTGSGKSTMAARLQHRGYALFADDFIPVRVDDQMAYPFPPAICIKKGSLPVLADEQIPLSYAAGQTGYIAPADVMANPCRVDTIIFSKFDEQATPMIRRITNAEALTEYLGESWVCAHAAGVEKFLDGLKNLKFFRLVYNSGPEGADALVKQMEETD